MVLPLVGTRCPLSVLDQTVTLKIGQSWFLQVRPFFRPNAYSFTVKRLLSISSPSLNYLPTMTPS